MASPNPEISSGDESPAINEHVSVIAACQNLNPTSPFFFPSLRYFCFLPQPIYFISGNTIFFPPPAIWISYPLWCINPNPNNQFQSIQELSPNPSQELSRSPPINNKRRVFGARGNKVAWRRRTDREVDSNGDHITTVMIRNIPNRYTREMMIEFMDDYCEEANKKEKNEEFPISAYDFLYLPVDFRTQMNKGYAFVNFTNTEVVSKFKVACDHKPWSHFYSSKVVEIAHAKIQGKDELVKRFEQMTYPVEAYSAVCFIPARSGSKDSVQTVTVGRCTKRMITV